jgi:hypothetical protein
MDALPDEYTPESVEKLDRVATVLTDIGIKLSGAYGPAQLREDLQELQEEIQITKAIAEEQRLEKEILTETKSLLVLQSQRHAAELPRASCLVFPTASSSIGSTRFCAQLVAKEPACLSLASRLGAAGLEQLLVEKRKADEVMAELRKARAKEDADFAAAEAAAAAKEWEQVYALRIEREEADKRAAEAADKLRQVEQEAARRCDTGNKHPIHTHLRPLILEFASRPQTCCTTSCSNGTRGGGSSCNS